MQMLPFIICSLPHESSHVTRDTTILEFQNNWEAKNPENKQGERERERHRNSPVLFPEVKVECPFLTKSAKSTCTQKTSKFQGKDQS